MKIKNVYGRDLRDMTLEGYGAVSKGTVIKAGEVLDIKDQDLAERLIASGRYAKEPEAVVKANTEVKERAKKKKESE